MIKGCSVCVCREAVQTAPHIIREPDADVAREKAYKQGEDVIMACVADRESNAVLVLFIFYDPMVLQICKSVRTT